MRRPRRASGQQTWSTSPPTSVRRKSRPWKRYVSFRWSSPSRCRIVACRSWTWTCCLRLDRAEAKLVGLADRLARLDAAAGQPHRVGLDMMVATERAAVFAHRRAAELATPDDQRVVEQAAPLEVHDQRRRGLIGFAADSFERAFQIFAAAVMVPIGVEQRDEAHAAFDQPAGQQAVVGERRLARLRAVQGQRFGASRPTGRSIPARSIACDRPFRRRRSAWRFRRRRSLRGAGAFRRPIASSVRRCSRRADPSGRGQIQDRIARRTQRHSLVDARQKCVAPQGRA